MKEYYFYNEHKKICVSIEKPEEQEVLFRWIDYTRDDVVHKSEQWLQDIFQKTELSLNEFHLNDILNLEHPCTLDVMDDYELLIFRKLITPDDQIATGESALEAHEKVFGLATTPVSFIFTPTVLVTVREQGNKSIEHYLERINNSMKRPSDDQTRTRRLPKHPLDLSLRLLNGMIDGYLDLRVPLTRRVEYWQQELLQGHRRFTKWHQLLQENMAFQQIESLCEEQIETLQELRDEIVDNYQHLIGKKLSDAKDTALVRVDDIASHIERIQKHTSRLRSAIQSAMDLHFSAIANQTNENMRILAIITAIFAPLTLLTGIYGMNFEYIPGLKSPDGFWFMVALMIITTLILLYYFYRQHLVGRGEKSVIDMLAQQNKNQSLNMLWFLDYDPIKHSIKEVNKIGKLTKWFVRNSKK